MQNLLKKTEPKKIQIQDFPVKLTYRAYDKYVNLVSEEALAATKIQNLCRRNKREKEQKEKELNSEIEINTAEIVAQNEQKNSK